MGENERDELKQDEDLSHLVRSVAEATGQDPQALLDHILAFGLSDAVNNLNAVSSGSYLQRQFDHPRSVWKWAAPTISLSQMRKMRRHVRVDENSEAIGLLGDRKNL